MATAPLSRTNSNALTRPFSGTSSNDSFNNNNGAMREPLGRRPSTANSTGRPATPASVTQEGSRVREMMKQRLTRQISDHRRSSLAMQQSALAEFHRRHGINVMRQRSRAMFHLLQRKARAIGHMIQWFKLWIKITEDSRQALLREVEKHVRAEDWYLLSERLLADSSHLDEKEIASARGEFVTLVPVEGGDVFDRNFIELRFNKRDFCTDRKTQESCLSPAARRSLSKLPDLRSPDEFIETVRCLKKLPAFNRFPLEMQKEIARFAIFDCYDRNRVLSRCGGRPDGWYLVLFGRVMLRPKTSSGTTENKFVGVGEIYGEDEVVLNLSRSYTVVTRDDNTEVLYIYRQDYLEAKDRLEGRCRLDDVRRTFSAHPALRHFQFETLNSDKKSWQARTFQTGSVIASHEHEKPKSEDAPLVESDFSVSNLTVSDLIGEHLLAKEKAKYFCVVQKGSVDVYGVCQEPPERKDERRSRDPLKTQLRLLRMMHPDDNEWRKMNKHCLDNKIDTNGFMRLLPDDWNRLPTNRELNDKVPRRFQRCTPFTTDPQVQPEITMPPVGYSEVKQDDPPPMFVEVPDVGSGNVEKTVAKIGKIEAGEVFGMESAVSEALKPWVKEGNEAGVRAKAIGVNQPPDIYFVSNGCQVVLVNKSVYNKGLERDAKCLNASQMPTYQDKISILNAKDDCNAWKAQKDSLRAHYREMMAKANKKTPTTV